METNRTMHPYSQPFFREGTKDEAVLLIHGFTATPSQMRPLADVLSAEGYAVRGILLPGHGLTLATMERSTWEQWLSGAEDALKELLAKYARVDIVGHSMGGLITLNLASRYPVNRIATLSTPFKVRSPLVRLTPVLRHFRRYQPWNPEPSMEGEIREPFSEGYPGFPVKCAWELEKLRRDTVKQLAAVKAPVMIVQSGMDSTVDPASPYLIYDHVSSVYRELLLLEHSRHNALLGPEREHLFADVSRFLALPDEVVREVSKHHVRMPEGMKETTL
jgi:carboxylesterase